MAASGRLSARAEELLRIPDAELDGRLSDEARLLARLAPRASVAAIRAAWARGLSVTVLEGEDIVSIAPDGTRTFVKRLEPIS